jgi:hypothetical protein
MCNFYCGFPVIGLREIYHVLQCSYKWLKYGTFTLLFSKVMIEHDANWFFYEKLGN